MTTNQLWYGDNLNILRRQYRDESIDLIYLDPPFNSNRSYNILFRQKSGEGAQAQIEAFSDTWQWSVQAESSYEELISGERTTTRIADVVEGMRKLLGTNDVLAYLVNMGVRLVELHRVLKSTGSLYLHCDPTASHYLKILLDAIFGPTQFRSEIIWRRTGTHGKVTRYAPVHDVILFFTKTDAYKWRSPHKPYMRKHVESYFVEDEKGWHTKYYGNVLTGSGTRNGESGKPWRGIDPTTKGRHWAIPGALLEDLDEDLTGLSQHEKLDRLVELGLITFPEGQYWPMYQRYITPADGAPVPDIWAYQPYTEGTVFGSKEGIDAEVRWLSTQDRERLGYPTQKPLGLLERIIKASSDPGDVVLDPFCGCGTTVDAAQRLDRIWNGIDITYLSIDLIRTRLRDAYGSAIEDKYVVHGIPRDKEGALALFSESPFDFERWAVSLAHGTPNKKQVADRGIDGVIRFPLGKKKSDTAARAIVSVKGGKNLNPGFVRDLLGTVRSENAEMGVLIAMDTPTRGVHEAAAASGTYVWPINDKAYPKIQVITVSQLLQGVTVNMPTPLRPYIAAQRLVTEEQQMFELDLGDT